jgi:hypothetical protein
VEDDIPLLVAVVVFDCLFSPNLCRVAEEDVDPALEL